MDELKYKNGKFTVNGIDVSNVSATTEAFEIAQTVSANTSQFSVIDNPEFVNVTIDSENKLLDSVTKDGVKHIYNKIEASSIKADKLELTENGLNDFEKLLKDHGFQPGGKGDWSDFTSLEIPEPKCFYVNITNINAMPVSKSSNLHAYFEAYDIDGNYFKKRVILNAQGNSSMAYEKKNFAIDMCNDEWLGDDTFVLKIGNWVPQDSFHFKAYYTDFFKCTGIIAYKLAEQVYKTRGILKDRPWKVGLLKNYTFPTDKFTGKQVSDLSLQIDNGARCMPDGIPCIVHLNGGFYGIFNWCLKKHRDNYHQSKSTPEHIQIDAAIVTNNTTLFGGTIVWNNLEIRNPKGLYCINTKPVSGKAYQDITDTDEAVSVLESGNYTVVSEKPSDWSDADIKDKYGSNPPTYCYRESKTKMYKLVELSGYAYQKYDGDNPTELIDDTMEYYDPNNKDHVKTNKVKKYIVDLSKRTAEINSASTDDEKKELLNKYFDVENLIDYQMMSMITRDKDGTYGPNWQWLTYDGEKWFVCCYDKDRSWGLFYTWAYEVPTESGFAVTQGPFSILNSQYSTDIRDRWKYLVDKDIFTTDNIIYLYKNYMDRFGYDYYSKEYEKWTESPVNRDSGLDEEHWELPAANIYIQGRYWSATTTYNNGENIIHNGKTYSSLVSNNLNNNPASDDGTHWKCIEFDAETEYKVGNTVYYGDSTTKLRFRAVADSIGFPPITKFYSKNSIMGYHDSLWRIESYIHKNIEITTNFINNINN